MYAAIAVPGNPAPSTLTCSALALRRTAGLTQTFSAPESLFTSGIDLLPCSVCFLFAFD